MKRVTHQEMPELPLLFKGHLTAHMMWVCHDCQVVRSMLMGTVARELNRLAVYS